MKEREVLAFSCDRNNVKYLGYNGEANGVSPFLRLSQHSPRLVLGSRAKLLYLSLKRLVALLQLAQVPECRLKVLKGDLCDGTTATALHGC